MIYGLDDFRTIRTGDQEGRQAPLDHVFLFKDPLAIHDPSLRYRCQDDGPAASELTVPPED